MRCSLPGRPRSAASAAPLHAFYRTLMNGTLLLPVPPEHGEEARAALESAINDDEQVEISVMLARESGGETVSVVFGSFAALAAWAPAGSGNLPLPARIAIANLAAAGMPAIMDPAGPMPYRFDADELTALAEGRVPGSDEPLFEPTTRSRIRVRLPGPTHATSSPPGGRLARHRRRGRVPRRERRRRRRVEA